MSVEFLCPHCRARMRTPDDAMGRETGCPKCQGRLTIPTVPIPEPDPVVVLVDETAAPVTSEPASTAELPVFPAEDSNPFDFSDAAPAAVATESAGSTSQSSLPTYKRRKKKSGWGVMIAVAVVVLAALGGFAFVNNTSNPNLGGALAARIIDGDGLSGTVTLPPGPSTDRIVEEFTQDPVLLKTELFETSFGASGNQLLVTVTRTDSGQLVEVDTSADSALAGYLDRNGDAFRQRRQGRLADNANDMAVTVGTDPVDREAAAAFRDSVGLASLQNTLGPYVVAEAGGFAHPVVSEPSPGVLRFVLPRSTNQFAIIPAPANSGGLPATMRFTVSIGTSSAITVE